MACVGCSTGTDKDGKPKGCNSNGGCSTGGCNKLNTYDWLTKLDLPDTNYFGLVEVSFKNGSRKSFFQNTPYTQAITGDMVVVESGAGLDIGKISLSGDLVRLQMKKKRVTEDAVLHKIVRIANQRDLERLHEARSKEPEVRTRARVIARTLKLDMKIGDVEFQGDKRKITIYYTADGRIDFRELIRQFAKEFRVKIEMRQIGARQESARIGGIGSCGRELCCSTWLTDFRSVSTAAARYQNLAINQTKLSGQCGRLKCCLNYELDTYMDALEAFPKRVDTLMTEAGKAVLVKTDIFKRVMYFAYLTESGARGKFYPVDLDRVKEIVAMNKAGEKPAELLTDEAKYGLLGDANDGVSSDFGDDEGLTGVIELPPEERKRRGKSRNKKRKSQGARPSRGGGRDGNRGGGKPGGKPGAKDGDGAPKNKSNSKPSRTRKPNPNKSNDGKATDGKTPSKSRNRNRNRNRNSNNRKNDPNNPNQSGGHRNNDRGSKRDSNNKGNNNNNDDKK